VPTLDAETWGTARPLHEYQAYTLGEGPDANYRPFHSPLLDRKCRLAAVAAIRRWWNDVVESRSRASIEVFEEFIDDLDATKNQRAESLAIRGEAAIPGGGDGTINLMLSLVRQAVSVDRFGPHEGPSFIRYRWTSILEDLDPSESWNAALIRCIFGNPFHPVALDPAWRTEAVVGLATGIYADRAFDRLPVLADALEDAGCADADVLGHCRGPGPHARGCWVVDLLLGKT
jgi:hypothetical protein